MSTGFTAITPDRDASRRYQNLDLHLSLKSEAEVRVEVMGAPGGLEDVGYARLPSVDFGPFPAIEVGSRDIGPIGEGGNSLVDMEAIGDALGEALLPGPVRGIFQSSLGRVRREREGLRLRLRFGDERLTAIPWEAARVDGDFLSLRSQTPIVRYVRVREEPPTVTAPRSIRILGVVSQPTDQWPLDVDRERSSLESALKPLIESGDVELVWLPEADLDLMRDMLHRGPHVIHYIGHGSYDASSCVGHLWFTDEELKSDRVNAQRLALLLRDSRVQFAFLNACQTGRAAGGVAEAFVRAGIPASLGMPHSIRDDVAIRLTAEFYRALSSRIPVDSALVQARLVLATATEQSINQPDWALPVLFEGPSEGQLFTAYDPAAHLPAFTSSFVGRDQGREILSGLLTEPSDTGRLFTMTGAGGVGKTRLAVETARHVAGDFAEGALFVSLESVKDAGLVLDAIASTLEIQERPSEPLLETLTSSLKDKRLLLILDNFEQVVDAASQIMSLVSRCPKLTVLVTSRRLLELASEIEFAVPALARPSVSGMVTAGEIMGYPAVQLFADRGRAASGAFTITNKNAAAVADICHRLDGLPLAIELAAARLRVLTPEELRERLQSRLRVLTRGPQELSDRHRTLRATIDWSYDLLDPDEQTLLRRLSVFSGGWTLESAESVCGFNSDSFDVLDDLQTLVQSSLVQRFELTDGSIRFGMLQTIREYGLEQLESGSPEYDEISRRHAQHFLDVVRRAEPDMRGPNEQDRLDELEIELDNLRTALSWAIEAQEEFAVRLAGKLWWFWQIRAHYSMGRRWLKQALEAVPLAPGRDRAKALCGMGVLATTLGRYDEAHAALRSSLSLYKESDDENGHAEALIRLGNVMGEQGEIDQSRELLEAALHLNRDLNNSVGIADALNGLGVIHASNGEFATAESLFSESLELRRAVGDAYGMIESLGNVGRVEYFLGNYDRALALLDECSELSIRLGDVMSHSLASLGRAWIFVDQQRYSRAAVQFEESLSLSRDPLQAHTVAESLEGLAIVAHARDHNDERAVRLLGASSSLYDAIGVPRDPPDQQRYEDLLADVRENLSGTVFQCAWRNSQSMLAERAIAYALGEGIMGLDP